MSTISMNAWKISAKMVVIAQTWKEVLIAFAQLTGREEPVRRILMNVSLIPANMVELAKILTKDSSAFVQLSLLEVFVRQT